MTGAQERGIGSEEGRNSVMGWTVSCFRAGRNRVPARDVALVVRRELLHFARRPGADAVLAGDERCF